ncbi:MAG: phosphatidylglycerophosphatase A [candidate division KSB1 bacterium]
MLSRFLATVGFIGYVPFAPGTAGSLVATLAFMLMPTYLSPVPFTLGSLAFFLLAVWAADRHASVHNPDPSEVVIDEVMGMVVAIAFLPLTPAVLIASFVLFRVFDIAKPFPVRQFEKLPGGWGIVMDDVMAGVYANVVLRAGMHLWQKLLV